MFTWDKGGLENDGIVTVHGIHRDADGSAGFDHLVRNGERTLQRNENFSGCGNHVVGVLGVRREDGKLVAVVTQTQMVLLP